MERFEIGIIGGTGGIGRWFTEFFRREGYGVQATGRNSGPSLDDLAARCRVVVVSVPMGATLEVIRQIGPRMPRDGLLMDFTSLKAEPVAAMLACSACEVMGCHPLFGPGETSLEGQNVILCPARIRHWGDWPRKLLESRGAVVTVTTPGRHDTMMAAVQVLNHVNTMTLGLALRKWSRAGTERENWQTFATPMFRAKLAMVDEVLVQHPELYAAILDGNPGTAEVLAMYADALGQLQSLVAAKDPARLAALLGGKEPLA